VVLAMEKRGSCLKIEGWSCLFENCPDLPQPPIDPLFAAVEFKPYIEYCPNSGCTGERSSAAWTTDFNQRTIGTFAQLTCFAGFVLNIQNWELECTKKDGSAIWVESK
jgi:hypothetical protein